MEKKEFADLASGRAQCTPDQWAVCVASLTAAQLAGTSRCPSDIARAQHFAAAMVAATPPELLGLMTTILVPMLSSEAPPTEAGAIEFVRQARVVAESVLKETQTRWPSQRPTA